MVVTASRRRRSRARGRLLGAWLGLGLLALAPLPAAVSAAAAARYQDVFVTMARAPTVPPPLLASTSLQRVEQGFPFGPLPGLAPSAEPGQLYVGFRLARLSCPSAYLAGVVRGPAWRLTVTVARHRLRPGEACPEVIGPMEYQVIRLPLAQFGSLRQLQVVLRHPLQAVATARTWVRLPG